MNYELTNDEIKSIERYQDNDFKIINTLLREGIESEILFVSSKMQIEAVHFISKRYWWI